MNCQEAQSNVLNYINHKLNKEEVRQFIEHIRECDDCRDELEIYYITMIGMQQIDDGEFQTADFQKALKEDMCHRYEQCLREKDRTHSLRVMLGALLISLFLWLIGQILAII